MKIRITKKGLPKAQFLFSQPGQEIKLQQSGQPNYAWTNPMEQAPFVKPVDPNAAPQMTIQNNGTPVAGSQTVVPIKQYKPGEWMNAKHSKFSYALEKGINKVNKGLSDAQNFLNTNKYAQGTMQWGDVASSLAGSVGNVASMFDTRRKNRDIERAYRQSLLTPETVDFTERRGDYEINTGMVDPYNTGAKSKGQFTNLFYTPQFQDGGISLGPISFAEEPVRPNVYQYATPLDMSFATAPAVASEAVNYDAPPVKKSNKSSGANPLTYDTWDEISSQFQGVKNVGIWGDKRHQKLKSDHNTGDALDIGITGTDQGNQIAQKLLNEYKQKNIKYVIWNERIWNPSISNEWRPYKGDNPHKDHVHVSFNRSNSSNSSNPEDLGQISLTHNNPLNIHQGAFASQYGGKMGSKDGNGNVSIFPDMNTGIKAAKDLLFGPNYNNLTISQARNKWVKGDPNEPSSSTPYIVKEMGGDKKLSQLTPAEKDALIKQFAKWEGKQAYTKIKDMQLYANGGMYMNETETPTSMKIRITKQPMENMAYGGQSGYGLDLGQRGVYTDMPDSKQDSVSNTIGPVPREEANIEAEQGETIYGDMDGDGFNEHMTISGKPHYNGGTPLNAPDGSFIYSKKLKEKNSDTLKMFNKTYKKGGVSYSDIAKQYDVNKYKAILEDPTADPIAKRTAEMMIGNYEKKLGLLAYAQEYSKGFPQGVPEVSKNAFAQAAYGGYIPEMGAGGYLEQYQTKGEKKGPISKAEFQKLDPNVWKISGNRATRTWSSVDARDAVKVPGQPGSNGTGTAGQIIPGQRIPGGGNWKAPSGCANLLYTPEDIKARPGCYNTFLNKNGFKDAPEADILKGLDEWKRGNRPTFKPGTPGVPTQGTKDTYICSAEDIAKGYKYNPATGKCEKPDAGQEELYYEETPPPPPFIPGEPPPYSWTQQDINNYALAAKNRAGIKKYSSVRPDINPVLSDFRNMDWRGRAAELQGTYNSQMNALGTFQSPTSLAANASFMSGQQGENLINRAIDPIEQANVQGYNAVANTNMGVMNQALANRAQNQFLRSQDRAILNQNYDNAVREADKALVMAKNQGLTNAAGIYNTNQTESDTYYIDPRTQMMKFNSPAARAQYMAAMKGANPNAGNIPAQASGVYKSLNGLSDDVKDFYMKQWIMSQFPNSRAGTQTTYPFNPRNNKTVMPIPQGANYNAQDVSPYAYGGYVSPWDF